MNDREKNEVIIKYDFGNAEGIYIIHCMYEEQCPCQDFYECLGVYKLLGWDLWTKWRKENCVIKENPLSFYDVYFAKVFHQNPY